MLQYFEREKNIGAVCVRENKIFHQGSLVLEDFYVLLVFLNLGYEWFGV